MVKFVMTVFLVAAMAGTTPNAIVDAMNSQTTGSGRILKAEGDTDFGFWDSLWFLIKSRFTARVGLGSVLLHWDFSETWEEFVSKIDQQFSGVVDTSGASFQQWAEQDETTKALKASLEQAYTELEKTANTAADPKLAQAVLQKIEETKKNITDAWKEHVKSE